MNKIPTHIPVPHVTELIRLELNLVNARNVTLEQEVRQLRHDKQLLQRELQRWKDRSGVSANRTGPAQHGGERRLTADLIAGWFVQQPKRLSKTLRRHMKLRGMDKQSRSLRTAYAALSPTFPKGIYLQENPDVAQSKWDPLEHYVRFGYKEGRLPGYTVPEDVVDLLKDRADP